MAGFRNNSGELSDVFFNYHNLELPRLPELPSLRKLNDSVYEFYSPPHGTSLDLEIIFFHGLEPEDCEMAYVETWTSFMFSTAICWPQTLLADDFPRARILSVSYNSSIKRGPRQVKLDLEILAEDLVYDLIDDAKVATNPGLPVILVGKDFGGLVIKAICMTAKDQNRSTFLSNLKGIFYYGTPHLGVENLRTAFNGALARRLGFGNKEIARLGSEFREYRIKSKWATRAILSLQTTEKMPELVISEVSQKYDADEVYTSKKDIDTICKARTTSSFQFLKYFISRIQRGKSRFEIPPDQGQTEEGVGFKTSLGFVNDERYVPMGRTLAEVKNALQSASIVVLHGHPGTGKTSLARYLALQYEAAAQQQDTGIVATNSAEQSDWLPNGVVYMTCGGEAKIVNIQQELLCKFDIEVSLQDKSVLLEGAAQLEKILHQALVDHLSKLSFHVVIVLDDVWDDHLVESLMVPGGRVKYLLTTQISTLWDAHDTKRVQMQDVTLEDARRILGNYTNCEGGVIPKELKNLGDEMIALTEYNPLALATLGIALDNRTIKDWREVKGNLKEDLETEDYSPSRFNQMYPLSIHASMMFVLDLLDENSEKLLYKITLFEGSFIPETLLRLFLTYTLPRDEKINISRCKRSLVSKSLVQYEIVFEKSVTHPIYGSREEETRGFRIHSLLQDFILTNKTEEIRRITYFLDGDSDHKSMQLGERSNLNLATALCALYGATNIKRRAAKRIGSDSMWNEESSCGLASALKPFVSLMLTNGNTKNPISEAAAAVFHKYVFERELDDDKISYLLKSTAYPSAPLATLAALADMFSIKQVKLIDEDNLTFLKVIVSHLDPLDDIYKRIQEEAPSVAPLIRHYASRALLSICRKAREEDKSTTLFLNVSNAVTVLLGLTQGAQSNPLARIAAQILDSLTDEEAKGTETKMFNAEGQLHPTGTDFVYTEQSDAVSDGVPENFPPHLPGHSPAHLDGIVGRGVSDQKDVEESTTTFTTSDAASIPTNTKVDCETRSLVETPQSSVGDGKGSKLLEVFLTEVNNSGEDGYFLSKKWLLTLDEHEREELFLVLGRNGYLEIYETLTTVFYEKTEEHVQVLSTYDDPSRAPENNDLCFRDENKVEPLDDGVTSSKIELTRFSATKRDGDLFNSSKSTPSLYNKTQLTTGKISEISPSDAPSNLLEKGEIPLTYSTEMLKSLKTAVKDSSLYNYAISTHWLSTLNDHQLEDLNSALSEAGYSEMYKTSTTMYFERIQGRIKNCPSYETDTVGTSGRNDIGGDTESSGLLQGTGNSLADDQIRNSGGKSSSVGVEENPEILAKCECCPLCLTVKISDLSDTPTFQSPVGPSTPSSQGERVSKTSFRQQVGDCFVTIPKNRKGHVIAATTVDKYISIPTFTFTAPDVLRAEKFSVNVSAGTSLTCCLRSDNKKVNIKFSKIKGAANMEGSMDSRKFALALGSVRTNVHASIVSGERMEDIEEISLVLEKEYNRPPWRVLDSCTCLASSQVDPKHSEQESLTLELKCDTKKRLAADVEESSKKAHSLFFEGRDPVIMEGDICGDRHQTSFLELLIRYQVEISYPKPSTPLPAAGKPYVGTIRRVPRVVEFDGVLDIRSQNIYNQDSVNKKIKLSF